MEMLKTAPTILVATWSNGLFVVTDDGVRQEKTGRSVKCLTSDHHGGVLAIVDGKSVCLRSANGEWRTIAIAKVELACCVAVRDTIFVGTEDAHILRFDPADGLEPLAGFDAVAGRDSWYAGTAVIDGRVVGPPLGIRSITATCDDAVLLANVHVGGIPRSSDDGISWHPTISIDCDVHQVLAHASRPQIVIAAAAVGLCVSTDAGITWEVEQRGMHAPYCSAVAFAGDDILVAAATDHFAAQGAVCRRHIDDDGPLIPVGSGLPTWLDGIADTACIATGASANALVDRAGNLYVSDKNQVWTRRITGLPVPSSVLVC
jgi:hypothetical protein